MQNPTTEMDRPLNIRLTRMKKQLCRHAMLSRASKVTSCKSTLHELLSSSIQARCLINHKIHDSLRWKRLRHIAVLTVIACLSSIAEICLPKKRANLVI